uniref:Putative salivary secreted peptide n=1 Tax=Anopheles braziliensis TaxID=58242 RepID=A0A2M3Z7C1_9DIPT
MAKLALLFIVIFCIIQFTFAARLRRDALEDGVETLKTKVGEVLNKENVDLFLNKLSEFGDLIKTKAGEIGDSFSKKASEVVNKE